MEGGMSLPEPVGILRVEERVIGMSVVVVEAKPIY